MCETTQRHTGRGRAEVRGEGGGAAVLDRDEATLPRSRGHARELAGDDDRSLISLPAFTPPGQEARPALPSVRPSTPTPRTQVSSPTRPSTRETPTPAISTPASPARQAPRPLTPSRSEVRASSPVSHTPAPTSPSDDRMRETARRILTEAVRVQGNFGGTQKSQQGPILKWRDEVISSLHQSLFGSNPRPGEFHRNGGSGREDLTRAVNGKIAALFKDNGPAPTLPKFMQALL